MKKVFKTVICLSLVAAMIASFTGCAKLNYITNATIQAIHEVKSGAWLEAKGENAADAADEPVFDKKFEAGTYGGVSFETEEDVVNYYIEAYDYTKSLTAQYTENGEERTYYKLLGDEDMQIGDVMIDGSANAMVNNLVPGIVSGMFNPTPYGLVPCYNRNPDLDNNGEDEHKKNDWDFRTSHLTPDDVLACYVEEVDGKIVIGIQPKAAEMAMRGEDSQGRFFEVLGDIGGVVSGISIVSFTEGTAEDNVRVTYKGGTGIVKIDPATKEIVEADYEMVTIVNVTHASITVIRDKSASLSISYKNHYPASDEFLQSSKNIVRK